MKVRSSYTLSNTMPGIIPAIVCLILFSCGSNDVNQNLPDLSSADKVELLFKTEFDTNDIMGVKKVTLTDPGEIIKLRRTFSQEMFPYVYCISSGSMTFYKEGLVLANVAFNTDKDYRHIAYYNENKLTALVLTEDDARMLEEYSAK